MSGELPQGWVDVALPEIAALTMGQSPPSDTYNKEGRGLPFFQGKTEFGDLYPTPVKFCSAPNKIAEPNDILISVRAPVGPTNVCRDRSCIGRGLAAIRPRGEIPTNYLLFYLRSIEAWLATQGTGSTFTAISKTDLEELRVRVAPLAEQRRIVAKLEKLLGKVDACRQRFAKIPALLKRFRQSVLAAACSGRLTADWRDFKSDAPVVPPVNIGLPDLTECVDGWSWTKLTDLARLESGHTPRKTIPEYWENGDVPWICLQDIRAANGKIINNTVLKPTMHGIDNSSARMLPAGTVVFSRDISVGYVTIMGREMATSQHFADWICGPQLKNKFLMYALMASRRHLISSEQGSTVGTIYMPALKEFYLLTPPLTEQQEIVRRVEGLFALADQIEARFENARIQVNKLTPSLFARAFRGQLVAQDPNDEPATVLLERTRQRSIRHDKSNRNAKRAAFRVGTAFKGRLSAQ
jgi:type I restriction enzyme S subunit